MNPLMNLCTSLPLVTVLLFAGPWTADAVSDWNTTSADIVSAAKLPPPAAYRAMALIQNAVLDSVVAVREETGATLDAAVAAANHALLLKLAPAQKEAAEKAFASALAALPEGPGTRAGLEAGERAAALVLARRADDGADAPESYRPQTAAGVYVPTVVPVLPQWPGRKAWNLERADEFRPEPPPALSGPVFARDFEEIRRLGARQGSQRTEEQTQIARFWEYSLPSIYFGVVRSVADMPGRDVVRNARLYAAAAVAMDDALISVFEAKYQYNFWRPITAIRNGDNDGLDATEREANWMPMIDAPMHPEFPSGHSILAGSVGAVVKADVGSGPMPLLTTSSPTAKGATRQWRNPDDFVREVSDSRIYAGIHFRTATDVGSVTGRQIGELSAARYLQPVRVGEAK